jgi:ATP-dependent HslUV protease ATP-binding subunit HslU
MPQFDLPGMPGGNIGVLNLNDLFGKAMGGRTRKIKTTVRDSYDTLIKTNPTSSWTWSRSTRKR